MVKINLCNRYRRPEILLIPTIFDDVMDKPVATYLPIPEANEKLLVIDRIRRTDIYDKLINIGVDLQTLAEQIIICQQRKRQHIEEVKHHKACKELDRKTAQNCEVQHKFYRETKRPDAERISRMVEISARRIFSEREDETRKAGYYHDFIRYCINVLGTRTQQPYPLIFAVTAIFDLRPEPGPCRDCKHFIAGTGCTKPPTAGRDTILMLRCKQHRIGAQEISNHWRRYCRISQK